MTLTEKEVTAVARLARLTLDEGQLDRLSRQITTILDYVDQLNAVDTAGVPPTTHAIAIANVFREDTPGDHLDRDQGLANAPETEAGTFRVPRIIE